MSIPVFKFCTLRVGLVVFLALMASNQSLSSQMIDAPASPVSITAPQLSSSDQHKEHWDQLRLKSDELAPTRPIPGEKASFDGFTRELLRVQWRGGDPIDLYIVRPVGVKNPPVVLYLYGYPTDSDRFLSKELCKNLTRNGLAAVGFASALTGQRYHDRPFKNWFVSELQESIGTSVHDVQMILNYLATRGDLDMSRVGMFGQGSGGTIAILAGAVDSRIKAVDVLDPWGDWPDWLAKSPQVPNAERPGYLKPEFLATIAPLDPIVWLPKYTDKPIRVQEALFNAASPEVVRKHIESALPANAETIAYKDQKEYVEKASTDARMLDWMHSQLAHGTESPKQILEEAKSDEVGPNHQAPSRISSMAPSAVPAPKLQ